MWTKLLLVTLLGTGACVGADVQGEVGFAGPVVPSPTLEYVAPGVRVVTDWGSPVFFADDYYWTWSDGVWLRSAWLGGPAVAVVDVPIGLRTVHHPWEYAHYHARPRSSFRSGRIALHEHAGVHTRIRHR